MIFKKDDFWKVFEIFTVGVPFSFFKMITGDFIISYGAISPFWGYFLITWGAIDLIINFINGLLFIFCNNINLKTCILSYIVNPFLRVLSLKHFGEKNLGVSFDTLLSFIIISIMISKGFLSKLTPYQSQIWSVGVILNILSAGVSRVHSSIVRLKRVKN